MKDKKIKLNRQNGIIIGGKVFISLLKALQITSKVLKEKIDYNTHVTLDKKYVQYSGDIIDMGIRKLSQQFNLVWKPEALKMCSAALQI